MCIITVNLLFLRVISIYAQKRASKKYKFDLIFNFITTRSILLYSSVVILNTYISEMIVYLHFQNKQKMCEHFVFVSNYLTLPSNMQKPIGSSAIKRKNKVMRRVIIFLFLIIFFRILTLHVFLLLWKVKLNKWFIYYTCSTLAFKKIHSNWGTYSLIIVCVMENRT